MNKLKIILINLLNDYVQVVNEALLLNENINIGWLFVRKANFEEEFAPHPISIKLKNNFIEFRYC